MYLKKHVALFLFSLFFILIGIMIINAVRDPFQILHKTEALFINNPRIQNAGLINNYLTADNGYDSVIIGNSLSMGLKSNETSETMGWGKVMKLSAAGSLPYTQKVTLLHALKNKNIKNVLWVLPIINYEKPEDALGQFEKNFSSFTYLYDNNPFNEINYLLNFGTLKKSISLLSGDNLERKSMYYQNLGYLRSPKWDKWSSPKNIKKLYKKYNNYFETTLAYKQNLDFRTYMDSKSLDNNLIQIIKTHPEVNFTLIIPPYSYFLQHTIFTKQLAGIELLLRKTIDLSNIKIYGFANEKFIKNLYYYRDKRHYSGEISSYMVHCINEGKEPLSLNNLQQYQKNIIINLNSYKSIYSKNTHIYSNYYKIKETEKTIDCTLNPKRKNMQVSFSLFKGKKFINKKKYSTNFTYTINKEKLSKGIYILRYTLINADANASDIDTYKEVGYSKDITVK